MKPYERMFGGSFPVKPRVFDSLEERILQDVIKKDNEESIPDSNVSVLGKDVTSDDEVQKNQVVEEKCINENLSTPLEEDSCNDESNDEPDDSSSENISSGDTDEPLLFENAEILKTEDVENAGLILVSAEDLKRTKKSLLGKLLSKKRK
ncbi:MAG: hypothetical protein KBT03_03235 [Bacteroidales bacterium]|nr:hypothetical protein [Candidatus Scybalousia scybalohippi]